MAIFDDSPVLGEGGAIPGGDWLSIGINALKLFSGGTKVSKAAGDSQGALNTSGWAIGDGQAEGSDLETSKGLADVQSWPWYVWAVGTLVAVAIIKKAV